MRQADGVPVEPLKVAAYYRRRTIDDVQPFPKGLRMIAGDPRATVAQGIERVFWNCKPDDPHEGDVPVYVQLASILRARIESGELPPRRAVPSKRMLMQEFGIAGGTVGKAIDILRGEGLVRTVTGRGIYVVPPSER